MTPTGELSVLLLILTFIKRVGILKMYNSAEINTHYTECLVFDIQGYIKCNAWKSSRMFELAKKVSTPCKSLEQFVRAAVGAI